MSLLWDHTNIQGCRWYDTDTLILNQKIQWKLFLLPNTFPNIILIATKNIDGFNAGLFFFRVDEWSVEFLSDTYSLPRLRPEIEFAGNIEQNSMKHLGQEPNKKISFISHNIGTMGSRAIHARRIRSMKETCLCTLRNSIMTMRNEKCAD